MHKITIHGLAKQTNVLEEEIHPNQLDQTLLNWLRHKKIPIASSCDGAGVCNKCTVNGNILSCQVKLKELLDPNSNNIYIEISYL